MFSVSSPGYPRPEGSFCQGLLDSFLCCEMNKESMVSMTGSLLRAEAAEAEWWKVAEGA